MNVIVMVSSGYPHNFSANNSKGEFVALGLQEAGCDVAIMDDLFGTKGFVSIEQGVSNKGIQYIIFPRKGHKLVSFFHVIPLIWKFMKERKQADGNHLLMGMHQYPFYFVIILIAVLLGYKRSTLFHEWHAGFKNQKWWRMIEANIKDRTFGYFLNLIFPISHYLKDKSKHFNKPTMLLPILADFRRTPNKQMTDRHFSYCCGSEYLLRSKLILDAFNKLHSDYPDVKLTLILSGYNWKKKEVDNLIEQYHCKNSIIIRTCVPQEELFNIYDTSIGLLIPLDPNSLQDKARFSQKIAEYVATKRPIITSPVGEIPFYFKNRESAMIVDYTAEGYYEAMKDLLENTAFSDRVGEGGYNIGLYYFDYHIVGKKIKQAIQTL